MRPVRVLCCLMIAVAVLFASAIPVSAIGFEAEAIYESVFVIYSGNALGSGFAVGENCIVTNAHVIDDTKDITVVTYGGAEYPATVLGMDEYMDIAVLGVKDASFPYLAVADLATMKTGDDIYAIGAPKGMAYTLTKGGISAKERAIGNQTYIQIDAAINKGNSGGPLLNDNAQVLGMNTLKMTDTEGIGLAIPITRVCEYVSSLGIKLDTNGNVAERVEVPEETEPAPVPTEPDDKDGRDTEKGGKPPEEPKDGKRTPVITYVAIMVAVLSLAANFILTVALMQEKRKCAALQFDPSERTDFDIEILE